MSVPKGTYHARWCPALLDSEKLCKCVAGTKGLARSREGFSYTGGDSKRAMERRRFQMQLGRLKVST
jgi:hypothetical protein